MPLPLVPREHRFFQLFDQQAANIVDAAQLLVEGLDDVQKLTELQPRIKTLEHAGDELTHELVRTLNKTFVTPFDREDIYALSTGLDDVLDYIDEIAETVRLYGITHIPDSAREMGRLLRMAAGELQQSIAKLERQHALDEHAIEVHRIENLGDEASRHAIGELFSGAVDPLTVIKLKEFYALQENALDRCEDVANVIESIAIKNA